jgi:GT2 family glycosyltransferase
MLRPGVQTVDARVYEVIVTDDSKEGIAETLIKVDYHFAKWVKGPSKGPAANRNNGAKYANGDWLVFIDDDCLPDNDLLKEYHTGIKLHSEALAFEGAIYPDSWEQLKKDMAECPVNTEGGCFWSANVCVNTDLFKQVGGFDERFLIAAQEDQQLKIDIEKLIQGEIIFLKDAKVVHPVRLSSVRKQLKKLPISSKNFSIYAVNNKHRLGYTSTTKFFIYQFQLQLKIFLKSVKEKKIRKSFVSLIFIFWAVPLNVFNFYSYSHRSHDFKSHNK